MLDGYAQRAKRPPDFPDAPEAIDWDSRIMTLCVEGENEG